MYAHTFQKQLMLKELLRPVKNEIGRTLKDMWFNLLQYRVSARGKRGEDWEANDSMIGNQVPSPQASVRTLSLNLNQFLSNLTPVPPHIMLPPKMDLIKRWMTENNRKQLPRGIFRWMRRTSKAHYKHFLGPYDWFKKWKVFWLKWHWTLSSSLIPCVNTHSHLYTNVQQPGCHRTFRDLLIEIMGSIQ